MTSKFMAKSLETGNLHRRIDQPIFMYEAANALREVMNRPFKRPTSTKKCKATKATSSTSPRALSET